MRTSTLDIVVQHLGGAERLKALGMRAYETDPGHVSLKLLHVNPRGVATVTIADCGPNHFAMECFGRITPRSFSVPRLGHAEGIVPENIATVLGQLTGDETLHHRHY